MKRPDPVQRIVDRELADMEAYKGTGRTDLSRLWRVYLRPRKWHFFGSLLLMLGLSLVQFGFPITFRLLIDEGLNEGNPIPPAQYDASVRVLVIVAIANIVLWSLHLLTEWGGHLLIVDAGQRLVYDLRRQLHEKLQRLHIGFYEHVPSGKIMSRVLDDVEVIHKWSTHQFVNLVRSVAFILVGAGLMLYLHWQLALIVFASMPLYAWAFAYLRPKIRNVHIASRRLNSSMYALAAERMRGIRVVKAFTRERRELHSLARQMYDYVRVMLRMVFYQQGLSLLAVTITGGATFLILWYGFHLVRIGPAAGGITLGTAVAFIEASKKVFQPVQVVSTMMTAVQAVFVVLHRVFRLLDAEEDVRPGSIHLQGMEGKVYFDHVTFTYPGQTEPALGDVDFHIHPGEKVALMGPSGAGKSTIFQLLLRFYDPQEGQVRVGGVNLVDADPGSIRRHVCMVQQEPVIFSGTVADNIIYGRLDATPAMVMEAAERAELHEFVMSLPVKYETTVGENGVTLSGGQKQRLALATALLTDPEVLLLDDTTSALDAATEARIRETLSRVLEGRTSFIITQRIATARDCDRVIVLEQGRITQMGNHAQLRQRKGFYGRICEQQESV